MSIRHDSSLLQKSPCSSRKSRKLALTFFRGDYNVPAVRLWLDSRNESPWKVRPMKRSIPVGETVSFTLNTGREGQGKVLQRISERRQPVILLIEQANGWRCFRFEEDVNPVHR